MKVCYIYIYIYYFSSKKYIVNYSIALFESALNSNLNKQDPYRGYETIMRPRENHEFLVEGKKIQEKLTQLVTKNSSLCSL